MKTTAMTSAGLFGAFLFGCASIVGITDLSSDGGASGDSGSDSGSGSGSGNGSGSGSGISGNSSSSGSGNGSGGGSGTSGNSSSSGSRSGSPSGSGSGSGGSSGSAGNGGDAGASCPLSGFAQRISAACGSCFTAHCSTACQACTGDTACDGAAKCLANPSCTSASCTDGCVAGLSGTSLTLMKALLSDPSGCLYGSCRSQCTTPRLVGDLCFVNADCQSGVCDNLASNGGWCTTRNCTSNPQCGVNSAGQTGRCGALTGGGYECFPGCNSNADCQTYQCGTNAVSATCNNALTVDGSTSSVCSCGSGGCYTYPSKSATCAGSTPLPCDNLAHCCPANLPYGCVSNLTCYQTAAEAEAACGSSCLVCGT
jgi:hypothetical protein